jgi:hypothetical protein
MKQMTIAAVLLASLAFCAHAAPITTVTSITVGDKVFSNFTCSISTQVEPSGPDSCAQIDVQGTTIGGNFGIEFTGGFAALLGGDIDFVIHYTVTAPSATITDMHLAFNGLATDPVSQANIIETVREGGTNNILGQLYVQVTNPALAGDQLSDSLDLPNGPYTSLDVAKDIHLFANSTGSVNLYANSTGSVNFSIMDQIVTQVVPEPAAIVLLGTFLVLAFSVRRRSTGSVTL